MNSVSGAGAAPIEGEYQIAVQKKINDAAADQGDAEVKLIQSSAEPAKATSGHVGTQLHVVG